MFGVVSGMLKTTPTSIRALTFLVEVFTQCREVGLVQSVLLLQLVGAVREPTAVFFVEIFALNTSQPKLAELSPHLGFPAVHVIFFLLSRLV